MDKMRYQTLIPRSIIFLCFLTLFNLPVNGQASFSGKWFSSLGNLELATRGSTVSGNYLRGSSSNGLVRGTLSYGGEILSGRWSVDDAGGRYMMRTLKNNAGFYGRWWRPNGSLGGTWIGVKQAKNMLLSSVNPDNLAGVWHTNYGRMTLNLSEGVLQGDYNGKSNSGTVKGTVDRRTNKFVATWKDRKYSGKVIIRMMKGGEAFTGQWWYADGEYGGRWYGVRYKALSGCIQGDCADGRGVYIWGDGSRYHGGWRNNIYHGSGQKYSPNGNLENSGIWKDGLFQGKRVSGEVMDGKGKLRYTNGNEFSGFLSDGEPDSTGTFRFANGNTYSGSLKKGQLHGAGKYVWANGDSYEGEFKLNRIEGIGTYTFLNGDVYTGKFRRGQRYGAGDMTFASGDVYSGRWRADNISGRGLFKFVGGDSYKGQFRKGQFHGRGTYTFRDSSSFSARWRDGAAEAILSSKNIVDPTVDGVTNAVLMQGTKPLPTKELVSSAATTAYVVYRQVQSNVDDGEGSVSEVLFDYYVIAVEGEFDEAAVREFFEKKSGKNSAEYQIEQSEDPQQFIRQFANRFQFSILPTRLNSSGERHFTLKE
ncbi:MAG: hypothetical protein ACRBF0_06390 [Calditrichia bacterium]